MVVKLIILKYNGFCTAFFTGGFMKVREFLAFPMAYTSLERKNVKLTEGQKKGSIVFFTTLTVITGGAYFLGSVGARGIRKLIEVLENKNSEKANGIGTKTLNMSQSNATITTPPTETAVATTSTETQNAKQNANPTTEVNNDHNEKIATHLKSTRTLVLIKKIGNTSTKIDNLNQLANQIKQDFPALENYGKLVGNLAKLWKFHNDNADHPGDFNDTLQTFSSDLETLLKSADLNLTVDYISKINKLRVIILGNFINTKTLEFSINLKNLESFILNHLSQELEKLQNPI